MRILIVIDGLPGGGAEKVVLTLAEGFLQLGHQVSLFSLRNVCDYSVPATIDYQVIKDNCHTPWRKLNELSRRAKALDRHITNAEKTGGTFNLVFSNLHKTDRIVSRSKVLNANTVWFCLHGMFSASYLGHRRGFDKWLKKKKIADIYQHRNIVAVSQAVADDIINEFGVHPRRLAVIANPFDIEQIHTLSDESCVLPAKEYLVHVGRFHSHKRHDRLLKAYALTKLAIPLVLIGKGSDEYTAKLKALAEALGISEQVHFMGFQKNPYPLIRHAKQLILSSDSEGFGNVLVEAMLCGTPVVSTRCPGGPESILQGDLARGLADLNENDLAEKILAIYHQPPTIEESDFAEYGIIPTSQRYLALAESE